MRELLEKDKMYIAQTYSRLPVAMERGKGCLVWDKEGREYLDCIAGVGVLNLGHSHPRIVRAIERQAERLVHTSNLYCIENQVALAERLHSLSNGYKSFFCNSGTEAVETALKLARKHTGKKEVISAENSFHGRTLGALSATGQRSYRRDFEPLLPGFNQVEYGSLEALEKQVTGDTAAVILEPVQGEGGVVVPPKDYLKGVEKLCRERGILFVLDEVQTGMGRLGELFAWKKIGVSPDIFTLAKALGSGFPIGAALARDEVMDSFSIGDHASTFGGNPLATGVAFKTIDVLLEEKLPEAAERLGGYLRKRLKELKEGYSVVEEVRGDGLMLGIELGRECSQLVKRAMDMGLLFNCVHSTTLRLLPPLIMTRAQVDQALSGVEKLLGEMEDEAEQAG